MHGHEKSDSFIVPKNPSNKSGDNKPQAEMGEGRDEPVENMEQDGMPRTQRRTKAQGCRGFEASVKCMSHPDCCVYGKRHGG
jgi:hypothetical protein